MDLVEFNTHSFIVKIWLEEAAEDHHRGKWRGHITHVPGGERRYLKNLGEIVAFIAPYLESMGVRLDAYSWLQARFASNSGGHRPRQKLEASGQPRISDPHGRQPAER
jgi:hypothetical protein